MAKGTVRDVQTGFAGGLNVTNDAALLRPDQARQLTNFRLNSFGAATKRGGTQYISSSTIGALCSGGFYWASYPTTGPRLFVQGGTALYLSSVFPGPTWTKVSGATTLANSFAGMALFVNASNAETVYIADGSANIMSYTAAGVFTAAVASTPASIYRIQVYNQRLWGVAASLNSSLYYSALNNGDSLGVAASSGGQIIVRTFNNSTIRTIKVIGSSLAIFHISGISRLTGFGQDDISVEPAPVDSKFSIIGTDAVTTVSGVGYAVSALGLYRITESSAEPVATPDRPDPLPAAIASVTAAYASGTKVGYNETTQEIWVYIPSLGIYAYHLVLQAWTGPWTGGAYSAAFSGAFIDFPPGQTGALTPQLLFTDDATSNLLYTNSPTYFKDKVQYDGTGGTTITGTLQAHRMFGDERMYSKAWRWITVMCTLSASGAAPTCVSASQNGGNYTMTFTTPASSETVYYLQPGGVGPYIDVTITDTNTASASQYVQIGVEGAFLGQR